MSTDAPQKVNAEALETVLRDMLKAAKLHNKSFRTSKALAELLSYNLEGVRKWIDCWRLLEDCGLSTSSVKIWMPTASLRVGAEAEKEIRAILVSVQKGIAYNDRVSERRPIIEVAHLLAHKICSSTSDLASLKVFVFSHYLLLLLLLLLLSSFV
ncbi:unnamed protein product [Polarella glacialis]|uniref:Uncharacterized protein n=1 Tax=Polarella glacialis TaxID=89957 RepID=A0A813ECA2_POLGL|nr:unnamed protein product [Polarella glacialis]